MKQPSLHEVALGLGHVLHLVTAMSYPCISMSRYVMKQCSDVCYCATCIGGIIIIKIENVFFQWGCSVHRSQTRVRGLGANRLFTFFPQG
ncbi:hypothetical protein COO60DRAFT_1583819 [Scenedesmus sp. NREL 46B-D3]|nr:hypothetical protein COO60DRAFT_1583819 [Scenedesmus sp. NREL 46B-D3]